MRAEPGRIWKGALLLAALCGCSKEKVNEDLVRQFHGDVLTNEERAYPLPYRLFVPPAYDPGRSYPMIVYLHGAGGRGDNNLNQLDGNVEVMISDRVQAMAESFVLAPQCPKGDQWVNGAFSAPFMNFNQEDVPEADASKLTFELLDRLKEQYNLDATRIYLTGPSMGGSGTWDYLCRHPGVFAAGVPVSGVNDPNQAGKIANVPIWSFHGADDGIAPASNSRAMVKALRELGSPVKYSELPGVGHNAWTPAYNDMEMYRWLFEQRMSVRGGEKK